MILKKIYFLLFALLLFSACQNEEDLPFDFSLSSLQDNGFSFEKMNVQSDAANQNIDADFVVMPQLDDSGKLLAPFLVQPQLKSSYYLLKQFDNLASAEQFYDSYTSFTEESSTFDYNALSIKPFQIWIVRTNSVQYGKVLITGTATSETNNSLNAVVNFKAELLK